MIKCLLFNVTDLPYLSRSVGIYRIAHVLREQNLDVEVADWSNWWQLEQLKEFFISRDPTKIKLVGFSHLFSIWPDMMEQFTAWIKTNYPHVEIFSGSGVEPQFKSQYIDYYIQGFGEHAVIALTKYLISNGPRPKFELKKVNGAKIIKANDWYPAFPMQSLMVRYQDRDFLQSDEWLTTEFARGCKFSCSFCNFPVLGVKGDYTRSADDFRDQLLDAYDRFGIKNYLVADETFNDSTEKITKFANVVEKLPFDPWFTGYIRADLMISRPQDREELLRMNFLGHFHGIESFNHASAKSIGKGMEPSRLKEGLIESKKYFLSNKQQRYRGTISLIAGLPHETLDSLRQTKQWLQDHWQGQAWILSALVLPMGEGLKPSKLSLEYEKYGYEIIPGKSADWGHKIGNTGMGGDGNFWKNTHMDLQQAIDMTEEFVATKKVNNFTPNCWSLGYKLKDVPDIQQRLDLSQLEFEQKRDSVQVDDYINKKLGINTG
jgi:hypothetical protein